ncbi:MAG TPA: type II toxin-antitoxin system VapC family toxin [Candidatus Kapabacteria bacterium]|jgi:predicted nucleic acid-binding protein
MNVIDSSGWLEYFAEGPNASFFAPAIEDISSLAALLSWNHKLSLADSIIYATARFQRATLWTQDADFQDLIGVQYCKKQKFEV